MNHGVDISFGYSWKFLILPTSKYRDWANFLYILQLIDFSKLSLIFLPYTYFE